MALPPGSPLRWCAEHGEQLDRVGREFRSRRKLTPKAIKPKDPALVTRWPTSDHPDADPLGRLPVAVRLEKLVAHLVAADGPVSRLDGARACGLSSVDGGLRQILRDGKAQGLIIVRRGSAGGLLPGPNAPRPSKTSPAAVAP